MKLRHRYLQPTLHALVYSEVDGRLVDGLVDTNPHEITKLCGLYKHSVRIDVIAHIPRSFGKRERNEVLTSYWPELKMWSHMPVE